MIFLRKKSLILINWFKSFQPCFK